MISLVVREHIYDEEWTWPFQFFPYAADVFGALGPAAKAAVGPLARVQGMLLHLVADYGGVGCQSVRRSTCTVSKYVHSRKIKRYSREYNVQ